MRRSLFLLVLLTACSSSNDPPRGVTFEFRHIADDDTTTFRATTDDPVVIARVRAELEKPIEERHLHINGLVDAGTGDNAPWSWHFEPGAWDLAEASIEVCDGTPTYVEENLDSWLDEVGRYCPWGSTVARELP
jgi:hypothetical protein